MNLNSTKNFQRSANTLALLLIAVALGAAVAAIYIATARRQSAPRLSQSSVEVIRKAASPVEIRFYAGGSAGAATSGLEERTRALLHAYQLASNGKVSLKELQVTNDQSASQAIQDGIKPYNLQKGDAAYLGIVVDSGNHKEVLPTVTADFERALEADVTRALDRVVGASVAQAPAEPAKTDSAIIDQIKAVVPNYQSVSLEEGTKTLRQSMLTELQKAGAEYEATLAAKRDAIEKATSAGDQAQLEALKKEITQAELAQAERVKGIVAGSTAQIQTLERLKKP